MTTRPLLGLVSLVIVATLAGCLPPRAAANKPPTPDAGTPQPSGTRNEEPAFSYEPSANSFEPPIEESFPTFAVTKPEIRDRSFDWDLQLWSAFDAYDGAATTTRLRAAARDILDRCMDQQRWFTAHTAYDPQYDEPMTMWRDAVDELCSGAADVERGIDRGDQPLVRKGRRAVAAARATMSSTEYLGAWGPLLIH